ncbi:MAG TPA: class II aldolase/adducin family protein [Armatimonadota bacterium]|nr:class II aldolase/adducin family protein [Armatimonadota bacterium]
MSENSLIDSLVEMSHTLGEPAREYAMLGEGNTSARVDAETFLVKASGFRLQDIGPEGFVRMRFDRCRELLDQTGLSDSDVKAGLQAARLDQAGSLMPSVEAALHAILLETPGVNFVGHAHPVAANAILCSVRAKEAFAGRLFPDEIVCCGIAPCLVDYIDPGLPLARGVRDAVNDFFALYEERPKVICLINHGVFTLGKSAKDVIATMDMFVKVCKILHGTFALGGPNFLTPDNVRRIHTRPDEHYRQAQLGIRSASGTT